MKIKFSTHTDWAIRYGIVCEEKYQDGDWVNTYDINGFYRYSNDEIVVFKRNSQRWKICMSFLHEFIHWVISHTCNKNKALRRDHIFDVWWYRMWTMRKGDRENCIYSRPYGYRVVERIWDKEA